MTGTIEDTETIHTLTRLLANEIDTSTAMAEELEELETLFRGLVNALEQADADLVSTIKTLDKTRSEHGHRLDVIKGFVQTGDFLALAEYLQVDVPISGGKRVQVGDRLITQRDYEAAPVGTAVAYYWIRDENHWLVEGKPQYVKDSNGLWSGCSASEMAEDDEGRLVMAVPA